MFGEEAEEQGISAGAKGSDRDIKREGKIKAESY